MIRSIFVFLNLFFWTTVLGTLAIISGLIDWSGRLVGKITRLWSKILLWVSGVKYRVLGLEQLNPKEHYFFVGNHESAYDIPLAFAGLPYHIVSIAKKELKKIPVMGWAMIVAKHIFVDRRNHRLAMESLKKAGQSLQKRPRSILLFPEGTRSKDGEIKRFKKGGLQMAVNLGIPVVPMAFCGTRDVTVKRSLKVSPGRVELRIGEPIDTKTWTEKNGVDFANFVRNQVIELKMSWMQEKNNQ